ncbi:MAG: hemolysin family protein [Prevotellaceae bacterium]|jgi:CBS domain containing-hemolysin-like protein|nr:hemolysin family protein [Prevotellaceae bacterium]
MDIDSLFKLLLALILVFLNGFFVASEFSIVKVRHSKIQLRADEGNKTAKKAEGIIRKLDAYLSATQLGVTLASLGLGWVGESVLHHIFVDIFAFLGLNPNNSTVTLASVATSFLIITMMHIVFGELVPKSIAIRKSEATTLFIAHPLSWFYNIFKPFIWLMNACSNGFLRMIKISPAAEHDIHSSEELQLLVKQSADGGEIEEEDYEIIKNAFDFTDHSAKQIMVPRHNIFSIDIDEPKAEIVEKILENGYSRIPVYKDSIDNIIGIFYAKEFARECVKFKGDYEQFDIQELIHEPFFVVGSKKISDLLKIFQQKKQHLAVVIDEFGGTDGIITLEDILEELVGEIQDEEDEEGEIVKKINENLFVVEAIQPLEEINERLPKPLPLSEEGDYNTLSGYVMHKIGDIPTENQEFDLDDYRVKITQMQNKSIEKVELTYIAENIGENMEK